MLNHDNNIVFVCLMLYLQYSSGRWSMHMQKACFSPSAQKVESMCLACVFALVSEYSHLANCYCYAIVKREICLGHL